jgi:hypothetical protein
VGGLEVLAFAVVQVENQVVFDDEVAGMEAEEARGLVDGLMGAFELDKGSDGSFVEVDEQILGPSITGRKFVGSAEFLVAEPPAEAEAFEDFGERGGVGEDGFEFFADFMAALGRRCRGTDGELFGRGFEGEEVALDAFVGRFLAFCGRFSATAVEIGVPCGGRFGTDAKELAMFREAAVRRVEEEIPFVNARRDRLGSDFGERAEERFAVQDTQLDFDFRWHGGRRIACGRRMATARVRG